jgi:hypothetical protein
MPHVGFPLFVSHFSHRAIGIKQEEERERGKDSTYRSRVKVGLW